MGRAWGWINIWGYLGRHNKAIGLVNGCLSNNRANMFCFIADYLSNIGWIRSQRSRRGQIFNITNYGAQLSFLFVSLIVFLFFILCSKFLKDLLFYYCESNN